MLDEIGLHVWAGIERRREATGPLEIPRYYYRSSEVAFRSIQGNLASRFFGADARRRADLHNGVVAAGTLMRPERIYQRF